MIRFVEFDKIVRLNREVIVTEKIDGTNASVHISEPTDTAEDYESVTTMYEGNGRRYIVRAGSRTGFIVPGRDNFGFAKWVGENAADLVNLGPGAHFGEWWGSGVQRRYGLTEKRFSLFNVHRWGTERPRCCHVVPTLATGVGFGPVEEALQRLRTEGSVAAPGFMKPEGVVAFHVHARALFKVTLEHDQEPKSTRVAR